jgi:electron transfer flavoprotein alpha/beta subunit
MSMNPFDESAVEEAVRPKEAGVAKEVIAVSEASGSRKKKPLETIKPEDFGVDLAPRLKTLKVAEPLTRFTGVKVPDVKMLVEMLKTGVRTKTWTTWGSPCTRIKTAFEQFGST